MYKRILGIGIFLCAISFSIFAGGRKDNESHEAENPAGFTNSIDIDNKKPGKYNFYIEAKDTAGNAALAGPDNIYIDPASDLPVVKIINPADNMHVQGNLKIVGVCVDDDGVDYVEFIINKGKDGKGEEMLRSRAEGNSFWSYFLDTSDTEKWTDGTYTISAWAVDINGLSGISEDFPPKVHKIHRVIWNLDRKKPETMVTSHEDGIIVTGKINLKGTVTDGNGIQSLEYSLDEGENYLPVKIKYDKKQDIYSWSLPIDTRKIEDGARVIWFKAVDGLGTMEMSAHLFFINNIGADIKIVYPEPGEPVNGLFTVAGYASHPVGLSAIQWKLGKESGEIPMVIGNPWWVQEFDLRGQKLSSAVLEITAIDYSGNKTVRKHQFKVNQNADLPVISLQEPFAKGAVTDNNALKIIGTASDNDGVASIFYSIDAQPAVEIPCTTGYFQFTVPDLAPGSHSLDIWAKDITGVEGNKITIKGIVNAGGSSGSVVGANSPSLNSLAVPDGKWVQNTLSIQASNVRLSEYSLDLGATWRRLTASETEGGGQEFTMNISDMEDGLIQISVRTADQSVKSFKVLKDTAAPVAQLIVPYSEARVNGTIRLGIAVKEAGSLQKVSYVLPAVEEEGGERQEIIAGIEPGKFIDILLDSEKPLDETMAIIFEDAAGNRSELKDWHFIIDEETDIPVVYIILPMENEIITNDFIVSGVMYDDDKIKQIYWRIDDDEEQVLEADNAFSIPVSLASLNDNEHTITVIAEDVFGVKSGPVDRTFRVSLAEPTVAVLLPELNTIVKETVLIAGTAADKNG
ncbi:MAG: Ig-like domain-containing protein, partial [Treponema sp.]|nr:Ig-like domain-containing protein [Treponema sp.]